MSIDKPILLLDIDGICANFIGAALPIINDITGRKHVHDDVDDHRMDVALSLSAEEQHAWYKRMGAPGICEAFEPYPGAVDGVRELKRMCEVIPVTATTFGTPTWAYERSRWLQKHLGLSHAIFTDGSHTKRFMYGDIFVEDKLATLLAWLEGPARPAHGAPILFRRRYNEREPGFDKFAREYDVVPSWDALLDVVEEAVREIKVGFHDY